MREIFPFLEPRLRVVAPGIVPGLRVQPEDPEHPAPRPLRVLCIGLLAPYKGPHVLIEAVQGLPAGSIAVSLYGGRLDVWNAYADQLEADAADLPIRFCGTYTHDQLSAILARHDVLVIPSICEGNLFAGRAGGTSGRSAGHCRQAWSIARGHSGRSETACCLNPRTPPTCSVAWSDCEPTPACANSSHRPRHQSETRRRTPRIWRPCMRLCGTHRRNSKTGKHGWKVNRLAGGVLPRPKTT